MTPQRKRIFSGRQDVNVTEVALQTAIVTIDSGPAVNIHGLNVTMGVSPAGPDETLVGRWYVVLLPPSVGSDQNIRDAWFANLNTISSANDTLANSEFIWGAGSIVCGEQSTFQHTFSPKSSRNAKAGARLAVIFVADAVSGAIDNWDSAATLSYFTSA